MSFMLGAKALKRLVLDKDAFGFFQAKLSPAVFKGEEELSVYEFTKEHFAKFQVLPALDTLVSKFPSLNTLEVPEPAKYYVDQIEKRYGYDLINRATAAAREILKQDQVDIEDAFKTLDTAKGEWVAQKYRNRILDVGLDAPELLLTTYHNNLLGDLTPSFFGWPYMDDLGGVHPGEIVSFVGRPATGKTFKMLYCALHNWQVRRENVLFVSMEMGILPIAQRIGAMYTGTPATQLKVGGFSSKTFETFVTRLTKMGDEKAKFFLVDGNLAASVEEIYALASVLGCRRVFIDGAYLLRHPNFRLDRFTRVAENVEGMKRLTSEHKFITYASWQFNKEGTKSKLKGKDSKPGLEHIGYSDAIGQISSIVIGILQEEGVETIIKRKLDLLKGRNGEVGSWDIHWDFGTMNFKQYAIEANDKKIEDAMELQFV